MPPKKRTMRQNDPAAHSSGDHPANGTSTAKPGAGQNADKQYKQGSTAPDHVSGKAASKKRGRVEEIDTQQKAPRRSDRGASRSQPSQQQLLTFLLSDEATQLCRPGDETEDIEKRGDIRTYSSSVLNPFEELLCAAILSRPISHRLGLRTIRTVLNEPYSFTSAHAIKEAGSEKVHQAIWDAKTQHKQKTAEAAMHIADVVLEKFMSAKDTEGSQMDEVRKSLNHDVDEEHDLLKSNIKGVGKTGLEIFFRRVQWLWDEVYPYVDDRTASALRTLGLPSEAEELRRAIDEHWEQLETHHLAGEVELVKKRRAFVTILERAIGADLESKIDAIVQSAGAVA